MDDQRFDNLTRRLASTSSRRTILGGAMAALAGAFGVRAAASAQVSQAYCGNVSCKSNPGKCKDGCVCCVYGNGNARCGPPGNCGNGGQQVCPPGLTPDPVHGCLTPTTTTSTTTTTTTAAPTTTTVAPTTTTTTTTTTTAPSTTTTTTAAPGCPDGSTNCNGICCASSCACLQRLDGGLSCVNATQGRGCSGGEAGACDNGFACIQGICRGICDASATTTTTTTTTSGPCFSLGENCISSNSCCNYPNAICGFVFDGSISDPPLLCCKPSGGSCSTWADCCNGKPCVGGVCAV